jgi:hypothetical protein
VSTNFTPIFEEIVDSSIWAESDMVVKVFLTMLAKKDRDYVVRASAFNIARWANKTEDEVLKALKVLSSPDKKRLEPQEFEGRRVKKVDDGWLLLNGQKYDMKMRLMFERARKARWARQNRGVEDVDGTMRVERPPGKTLEQAVEDTRAERGMRAGDFSGTAEADL